MIFFSEDVKVYHNTYLAHIIDFVVFIFTPSLSHNQIFCVLVSHYSKRLAQINIYFP